MKFTVLVLNYNANPQKTFLTLQTIIDQKFDSFEVVIADDGSKDNHFPAIREYLERRGFQNYKLVANEKNQGTVKNILSGLAVCEGKYVKFISSGDGLYAENTLQKVYDFMEENRSHSCFGLLQGYQKEEEVVKVPYFHPFDLVAYRKKDTKRILKNLTLYSDNVCGAAICYEKEFALEYMNRIQNEVVYEEDIFQVLAAVEGKPVDLFDDYMVWYEIGSGISTKKGPSKFDELLRQDVERFYRKLYDLHPENKYVKKRFHLMKYYKIKNLYLRTMLRTIENPDAIRYLVDSLIQRKRKVHQKANPGTGFLEQQDFWDKLEK